MNAHIIEEAVCMSNCASPNLSANNGTELTILAIVSKHYEMCRPKCNHNLSTGVVFHWEVG